MRIRPIVFFIACLAAVTLSGCSNGEPEAAPVAADSATQRQRDSAIGESRLPGARGVRGALDASDEAAARAARLDSASRD